MSKLHLSHGIFSNLLLSSPTDHNLLRFIAASHCKKSNASFFKGQILRAVAGKDICPFSLFSLRNHRAFLLSRLRGVVQYTFFLFSCYVTFTYPISSKKIQASYLQNFSHPIKCRSILLIRLRFKFPLSICLFLYRTNF